MNGKIRILDESVANIIAAGEVVENPASMIKELVENSLDAGADSIVIEVESGGKYVKISDNGCGMVKEDLFLSIERHATSKISVKEDIFNLKSYGFRGEALASIAAVSKLTISSRVEEEKTGSMLFVVGGSIKKSEEIQRNRGTDIEVKDLFYNTPARLKFLRSENTEYNKIRDIITKEAIGCPEVAFSLKINGKEAVRTSGNGIESAIVELFGKNCLKSMIKSEIGYLGNQDLLKSSKEYIFTYFNRRYAKSQIIESAVIDGYYTGFEKGKYPFAILFIEVAPGEIDVNVHPSKKVVKFSNGSKIYDYVKKTIEITLADAGRKFMPELNAESVVAEEKKEYFINEIADHKQREIVMPEQSEEGSKIGEVKIEKQGEAKQETKEKESTGYSYRETVVPERKEIKIIGQIRNMYIVCEGKDGMEIYDQHIVHERILYEELKEHHYGKTIEKQHLLIPKKISFDRKTAEKIIENRELFSEFGFEIEEFGDNEIVIRTVPAFELRAEAEEIFEEIAGNIEKSSIKDIRESVIISMSCKGAIKAGEILTMEEMKRIIDKLNKIGKFTCPHGRPIILRVPFDEMDKKFGRK